MLVVGGTVWGLAGLGGKIILFLFRMLVASVLVGQQVIGVVKLRIFNFILKVVAESEVGGIVMVLAMLRERIARLRSTGFYLYEKLSFGYTRVQHENL